MGMNTIPPNPFPPSTDTMGGNAKPYELPIASTTELGGVKVGSGLAINAETGVLINNYSLPIASDETLGGVKVGSGLSINAETGVLSATSQKWDYSTSEVNTGQKWIDGKDIFCKVYNNVQLSNGTDVTIDANFGTDKNLIRIEGIGYYTADNVKTSVVLSNYLVGNDKAVPKVTGGTLLVEVKDNWSVWTCNFIVYYTKTEV